LISATKRKLIRQLADPQPASPAGGLPEWRVSSFCSLF